MMSDGDIFKLSAVVFFIGILLLIAAKFMSPPYVPIRRINSALIGKTITTSGTVKYVYSRNGVYFITLENESRITVVFFHKVYAPKGRAVSVVGKVNKYRGSIELIGEKINI